MTNLTTLASQIHADNRAKGFWDHERPLTETTMLIVTELAEAVEEERAGNAGLWYNDLDNGEDVIAGDAWVDPASHLAYRESGSQAPLKPEGIDIELIDALIRLLDLLGSREVDVDELLKQKLAYNATRAPKHGKAY